MPTLQGASPLAASPSSGLQLIVDSICWAYCPATDALTLPSVTGRGLRLPRTRRGQISRALLASCLSILQYVCRSNLEIEACGQFVRHRMTAGRRNGLGIPSLLRSIIQSVGARHAVPSVLAAVASTANERACRRYRLIAVKERRTLPPNGRLRMVRERIVGRSSRRGGEGGSGHAADRLRVSPDFGAASMLLGWSRLRSYPRSARARLNPINKLFSVETGTSPCLHLTFLC
jgi:hypothetical protein